MGRLLSVHSSKSVGGLKAHRQQIMFGLQTPVAMLRGGTGVGINGDAMARHCGSDTSRSRTPS